VANPCLDNQTRSEASPARDPFLSDIAAKESQTGGAGEAGLTPEPAKAVVPERGKVLLLDDDTTLRELITTFLAEHGYKVIAVENGGEGVREVLASDFTLVLCDFMMPGLPGDLFYDAVARIRPDLCKRFVFMTGHRDDAKTNAFVSRVGGQVLWKPFGMSELLSAISVQEVRCAFPGLFEEFPREAGLSKDGAGHDRVGPGMPGPKKGVAEEKLAAILSRTQAVQAPALPSRPSESEDEEETTGGVARAFAFAGIFLVLVLAGGLWKRHTDTQERVAADSEKCKALQEKWGALSPELDAAVAMRAKTEKSRRLLARVSADRTNPRWTPVLRAMLGLTGEGIEVQDVHARGEPGGPGGCEMRITAGATGTMPRQLADRFLQTVKDTLVENSKGLPVTARFEELADLRGATPDEKRTAFVVIARSGPIGSSVAARKGGR